MKFLRSSPGAEPVTVSGTFNVPVARLFKAWTEPEEIKQWFGPRPNTVVDAEVNLQVGAGWRFVVDQTVEKSELLEGQYLEIEENAKLVFSWRHIQEFADGRCEATDYSKVTVCFIADGDSTRLELRHEAIKSEDGRKGVGGGWLVCFESIAAIYE